MTISITKIMSQFPDIMEEDLQLRPTPYWLLLESESDNNVMSPLCPGLPFQTLLAKVKWVVVGREAYLEGAVGISVRVHSAPDIYALSREELHGMN